MDDSFSFSTRKKMESFFSPPSVKSQPRDRSSSPDNVSFINYQVPCSSKAATTMDLLCTAIEVRDCDTVAQILVDNDIVDVDVNQVVPGFSMSLLHLAVGFSENDPTIVNLLLHKCDGDPNNRNSEGRLSPLHISVMYDHDRVMKVLIDFGGDPRLPSGDGETCYDIIKSNVEDQMLDKCFSYLFTTSRNYRKSIAPVLMPRKQNDSGTSGSDGFYSCESKCLDDSDSETISGVTNCSNDGLNSLARRLFPKEYSYLMTEDESSNSSGEDEFGRKKLTTIVEESGIGGSFPQGEGTYAYTPSPLQSPLKRGIASMTAPYLLSDDESVVSRISDTTASVSCVNSTPPMTPQPTKEELEKLKEQMKQLRIPVTPSTFGVISKYAESDTKLEKLMSPKKGAANFSSELQAGLQNLNLIVEWGNHLVDILHKATPTANMSKSFYNYLLLDPRVIKKENFSGDHLKAGVITNTEKFQKFLLSVFYIGKAHGKRPLQHLVEAKAKFAEIGKRPLKNGEKIDRILEIWRSGNGVIIVSVFHHSSEREANVNEACMIDAVGLVELSNLKKGSYTGTVVSGWPQKKKNQLGSSKLYKCFCAFAVSDAKQFHAHDIL